MTGSIGAAPMPVAPRPRDDRTKIAAALSELRSSSSGREVADFLAANSVKIRVLPDSDFARRYPGSGAVYDPMTKLISLPQGGMDRPSFVTTLAHEGKHAMDFQDRPHWMLQSLGLIGGSAADGAKALVTARNPLTAWLDSITARQNEDEVNAYHLQAKVAHELGRNESRWSLGQARDGTPLALDDVRANVATHDLYRMDPQRRLVLAAGLGLATTSVAAVGAELLAEKLRPGSYLAANGWPIYALGGALAAAWVIGDQVRARRLEDG